MSINSFRLINYKNHPDISCECRDVNVFVGKNGAGKTNILEALYLLINARTLPGQKIHDVVRTNEDSLFVQMSTFRQELPVTYGITYDSQKKKGNYLLAGSSVSRLRYVTSLDKRAVFFSPQEMNTLYLGPDGRRDFLDEALLLAFPAFAKVKSEYGRILKQRNKLLKNIAE
jgi:DNA replication and repair protein RecF